MARSWADLTVNLPDGEGTQIHIRARVLTKMDLKDVQSRESKKKNVGEEVDVPGFIRGVD